jgi:hypothetical protein
MKNTFVILLLILVGCSSDVVNSSYANYEQAEADDLFKRGWLPSSIPKSSKNIKTKNNLDLNTSVGEFTIDMKESNKFIAQLKNTDKTDNSYNIYKYENGYTAWEFKINPKNGHVKYEIK